MSDRDCRAREEFASVLREERATGELITPAWWTSLSIVAAWPTRRRRTA